jgi:hypothetical protein
MPPADWPAPLLPVDGCPGVPEAGCPGVPEAATGVSSSVGSSRRSGSSSPAADASLASASAAPEGDDSPLLAAVTSSGGPTASLPPAVDWPAASLLPPAALAGVCAAPPDGALAPPEGRLAPPDGRLAPLLPEVPDVPLVLLAGGGLAGGDDCGWVGVLALGQPDNNRHRQLAHTMPISGRHAGLLEAECFDKFLGLYRMARLKPRSEGGFPQSLH